MKIRNKINLALIGTVTLIMFIFGYLIEYSAFKDFKDQISSYLFATSRDKAEHITTFLQEQKKTAAILAAASVYRDFLKEPADSDQYPVIKDKINKRLTRTVEADNNIIEALIIGKDGKVLASSIFDHEGEDKSGDSYYLNGQTDIYIKDIYYAETNRAFAYTVSAPVKDDNGDFLGISVVKYDPKYFFEIVRSKDGLGSTEESYLVNHDQYFITPSKFMGDSAVMKFKVDTQNVRSCFDSEEVEYVKKYGYEGFIKKFSSNSLVEGLDYRGTMVMGVHAYIPVTHWCLLTKIDKVEAFQNIYYSVTLLWVGFLASIITIYILIYFLVKKITKSIGKLILSAEEIKQGNLNSKIDVSGKDEIGNIARAFQLMISALKESRAAVDKKVKEQTREIIIKEKELEKQKDALLNVLDDVTQEKEASQKLANELKKFQLAVENATDHVVITDVEGTVLYGNKAAEIITGYSLKEMLGQKAGKLWRLPMAQAYYENLWGIIKIKKQPFVGQLKNCRKNGEIYDAQISIAPVLDKDNNIIFFVGIEHDITKEKQIDQAKTEFVSLASHQLRTPLTAINWYTEMLLSGDAGKINTDQKKYLEEIYKGNQRMVELVNALLNVSRLELGTFLIEPELSDIVIISEEAVKEIEPQLKKKQTKLIKNYGKNLPKIMLDKKLMHMVFQNLLSNAVKYTPAKGKISLNIELDKNSINIKIADNGYGITKSQQDKIFTKLFRADNVREKDTEGTGLGLYIVKSIIDHGGGKIWFESEENKGTTFYIKLPLTGMKKKQGSKALN